MGKNVLALLIASALVLLSAAGITYLSTERTDVTPQPTMSIDGLTAKRTSSRVSVSVYGLQTRIVPISFPGRIAPAQAPAAD